MKPKKPFWCWGWRWFCYARDSNWAIPGYPASYNKRPVKPGPKRDGWDAATQEEAAGHHPVGEGAEAAYDRLVGSV